MNRKAKQPRKRKQEMMHPVSEIAKKTVWTSIGWWASLWYLKKIWNETSRNSFVGTRKWMGRVSMVLSSIYHACETVLLSLIKIELWMGGQQHMWFTSHLALPLTLSCTIFLCPRTRMFLSGWKDNMVKKLIEWSDSVICELYYTWRRSAWGISLVGSFQGPVLLSVFSLWRWWWSTLLWFWGDGEIIMRAELPFRDI